MSNNAVMRSSPDPNVSQIGALIGDRARTAMLFALLDGRTLPATELARRAGVSPNSASGHLAKLVDGGLLVVEAAGRQRLYRMATSDVGRAIEALAAIAKPAKIVALSQSRAAQQMRIARSCYDHLAGKLGVGITEALVSRKQLVPVGRRSYRVTADGSAYFLRLGIDVEALFSKKRSFARQCIDWTERRPHLAGALGAALREYLFEGGWIACTKTSRALRISPEGHTAIEQHFGIRL